MIAPMTRNIAFLRAINVGGHTVKMADLRALFEGFGYTNVETFIASGQVIFDTPSDKGKNTPGKLEAAIENGLQKALGYAVATFIRSTAELAALAHMTPFGESEPVEGSRLYVGLIKAPLDAAAQKKLSALISAESQFDSTGREVFWLARKSSADSDFSGAIFEKTFRIQSTWRNTNTIQRMAAQFAG